MHISFRRICSVITLLFCAAAAFGQAASDEIAVNQNRTPAGKLENGVLTLQLEIRSGSWHPQAEDGPRLFVQAFGEPGRAAQIPGPLVRVPAGTEIHVLVSNQAGKKATVFGLNTRPGDAKAGIAIESGESREWSFPAGAPGTYYYWARTTEPFKGRTRTVEQPLLADAQLNGAFIVDPPGEVAADRIFVLGAMVGLADVTHEAFEVLAINGKSYPYTEPLSYRAGEAIRWRVINPTFGEHPMHLHGAFYQVLSSGDFESDTLYPEAERQRVVTRDLMPSHTMMLEWTPVHEGRWLFHCHFDQHISTEGGPPMMMASGEKAAPAHEAMPGMNDMAGLVLAINVTPGSAVVPPAPTGPPHKVDLVIEPSAESGKTPTFSCAVREGKKMVASQDRSMGPPIVLMRGEPAEINVVNHLSKPTTIHWHGMELEAYYDGVIGGGAGSRVTPGIAPGQSFTARFTPNRAGTFIYHTHAADPGQLSGGIYGPLIVLEPGESYDAEHDRLVFVGTRDDGFYAERITVNGTEHPSPVTLQKGAKYRLRIVNMAPDLAANLRLGSAAQPMQWRALAKDGAALPPPLMIKGDAVLHLASGEAYDFELEPQAAGEFPMQVENAVNKVTLAGQIVVR
jgi:FtsP/CotA-like multicopper oxidase with cupredoxin domain